MQPLRYGIIGGGFISTFQLRALRQVRGVEVAGLVSRRSPDALAAYVRKPRLGEGRGVASIQELGPDGRGRARVGAPPPSPSVSECTSGGGL